MLYLWSIYALFIPYMRTKEAKTGSLSTTIASNFWKNPKTQKPNIGTVLKINQLHHKAQLTLNQFSIFKTFSMEFHCKQTFHFVTCIKKV